MKAILSHPCAFQRCERIAFRNLEISKGKEREARTCNFFNKTEYRLRGLTRCKKKKKKKTTNEKRFPSADTVSVVLLSEINKSPGSRYKVGAHNLTCTPGESREEDNASSRTAIPMHASCLHESGGWRWKERTRELNGVLVRAVGSSGSTARRRLPARFSIGRTRDSGAGRACNDVKERGKRR